ncbi:hypothetical protein CEP54_013988 [Fusarium duplospermum]|uniref:Cytochrome P450 n=1 Tax=Fusarium duplospermum TaxID=1325734 RepID=A0A428NZM6_9HYPO|nr:hypothetical protein CEP54_013988 [Fusarium duplospermum]
MFDLFRQRPQTVAKWHQLYGRFVQIAPGQVSVSDVNAMRDLYSTSKRNPKSDYFDHFIYHNARSIFAEKQHQDHQHKRGLLSSFYQATSVYKPDVQQPLRDRVLAAVIRIQEAISQDVSGNRIVDVFPIINHFAWDNTTALVLGPHHCSQAVQGDESDRDLLARLKNIELWGAVKYNLPLIFHAMKLAMAVYTRSTKYFSAEHDLDTWAMQRIQLAISDPKVSSNRSIVQIILDLRRSGRSLSDDYLASEVIDNLYAGQATVTVALTYVVYHLSRNPYWQSMVQKELDDLRQESDGLPDWTALNKAPTLEACVLLLGLPHVITTLHNRLPGSEGSLRGFLPSCNCLTGSQLLASARVSSSLTQSRLDFHPPHLPSVYSTTTIYRHLPPYEGARTGPL